MISILKNLYRYIRKVYKKIDSVLVLIFYRNTLLANIYYLILSKNFYREHRSVLAGRAKYLQDIKSKESSYYRLVRNVHRIEKGLTMQPRRDIFAKKYIEETVDSFKAIWLEKDDISAKQIQWFHDVLKEYFQVVESDKLIDRQKERFKEIIEIRKVNNGRKKLSIPYVRIPESDITYEDFFKLQRQRRSVRWFLDKPVPRELIDKAILAAIQAPSACNRQPFFYRVFDKPELVEEVSKIPMGTSGYAHNIKTFILVIGNLDAYFSERDRHLIYIDASLANMNLMLALETMGLSSCPINWPDIGNKEKKLARFLELKPHQRPVMCIGIGYADPKGKVAFSEKRELSDIRSYNFNN